MCMRVNSKCAHQVRPPLRPIQRDQSEPQLLVDAARQDTAGQRERASMCAYFRSYHSAATRAFRRGLSDVLKKSCSPTVWHPPLNPNVSRL